MLLLLVFLHLLGMISSKRSSVLSMNGGLPGVMYVSVGIKRLLEVTTAQDTKPYIKLRSLRSVHWDQQHSLKSGETLSCEPTVSSLNDEIDFKISFDNSDDEDYTPTVSCFNDLDYFKDSENEFPAIAYNDALTSKSDLLTEPILSPQHIDEFELNDETSFSKYDEEEQNVLYFNDLFPFNIIHR
ncbi:hypothetical protein Tco_1478545 [Tanacetum coccineum]